MNECIDRNARAVQGSVRAVVKVREADLPKPTPCAGWNVADLLTHMTVQHRGFAAAAQGDGADLSHWTAGQPDPGRLVSEYALAADRVIAAFAAEDILERKFCLPEISTQLMFPAHEAIGFHLVDYVVHGWDVARSLGFGYDVDADVLDAALAVAQAVPDDDGRRRPGAPFAPRLETASLETASLETAGLETAGLETAGLDTLDRILTLLGRDPAWPGTAA